MTKIFISYRRADPDQQLACFLQEELRKLGHDVFRDVNTQIGQRWARQIQKELEESDYFVILISEQSMDRDMVRQEMQLVHAYNKRTGRPGILPVRLAYIGPLPYDMAAWLDPLQYAHWEDASDNSRILKEIAKAIAGTDSLPQKRPRRSEDQIELIRSTEQEGRPLLRAEPVLDVLALSANNPFYVKRQVDDFFYDSLRRDNGVATLHAARQMGKSSLFARVRARLESRNNWAALQTQSRFFRRRDLSAPDLRNS